MSKIVNWFQELLSQEPKVKTRSPVIIPREITPFDFRFQEREED